MSTSEQGNSSSNHDRMDRTASRRKFLRQIGVSAVGTAALAGMVDITGMSAASAATQRARAKLAAAKKSQGKSVRAVNAQAGATPAACTVSVVGSCTCAPGNCGGPCPKGYWCNYCQTHDPTYCASGFRCIAGGCNVLFNAVVCCID